MADHGWPSGKAKLSASRSWSRARASERRPSENRVIRSRIRSITAERASERWKGKGMDDLTLPARPIFRLLAEGRGKNIETSRIEISRIFSRKDEKGRCRLSPSPLNPFYGVVATEDK